MSAKANAIGTYILVSIFIMLIEYLSGVPLNIYHYLDLIIEEFSDTVTPMLPTTGNWADSANDAISMMNIVRFLLRVLSSPIPLIAAIIVYLKHEKESIYW
ncbi:MAG: hypothetical protein JJE19_02290 [Methanosarcinales archaeon]|nr:hypothetical protein [Methanosarcinales archaeon]